MAQIVQSHVELAAASSAAEADASPIADKPVVSEQTIPHGADLRIVFQGGLFMLALLAALYADGRLCCRSSLPSYSIFYCSLPCVCLSAFSCRECSAPFF
jgi:hypothetical protein